MKYLHPSSLFALLSSALALYSLPAWADESSAGTSSPQIQYRKAHDAIKAKRWDEARSLLLDLWSRAHTYDVSSSLVYVENQAQHFAAAANYATFAIRNAPPIEKPEEIERLRRALDELKQLVGAVTVVTRAGAEIRVDSEPVGTSPLSSVIYVDIGPHQIEARLASGEPAGQRIDALAGQSYRVELALAPDEPAQPPTPTTQPNAPPPHAAGTAESRRPSYVPAIVAASAGGVGLVGGIISFVVAANKHADAEDRLGKLSGENPCGTGNDPARSAECSKISDLADSGDTFRALGYVGIGTAVAGGVLTYVLWPRAASSAKGAVLSPTFATTGHGFFATVRGAF
jgi:hypothetical protein